MVARKVGIRAVAAAAGVSVTTVSHVLNDVPGKRIHPDTRERVRAVAAQLGYLPNTLAQGLRTQRSYTLGFVSDQIATTPYAGRLILGAQETASKHGWMLLLVNSGGDPDLERQEIQTLLQRQVDGLLYAAMYHHVVTLPSLLREVPSVLLDARADDASLPSVVPDEVSGGRVAVEELLRHGHRRIGFVTNVDDIPASRGRLEGYRAALRAAGVRFNRGLVVAAPASPQGGFTAARALLERENRPTGLFCFNDRMAMGAYQAAAALGLTVPHDVSIVGFDNQEVIADGLFPALTTVALPHYEMGAWAVDALIARIEDHAAPAEHAQLPCPLISRSSVTSPPRL